MAGRIIMPEGLGLTFGEFSLLPGFTSSDCRMTDVSLESTIAGLNVRIPLLSAAMSSVTGYELAFALANEGGIPVLPVSLPITEQADIVARLKAHEMGFVDQPETIRDTATIEQALSRIERYGHSKVPVVNKHNKFLGVFVHNNYLDNPVDPQLPVTKSMVGLDDGILTCKSPSISTKKAQKLLRESDSSFLVVTDQYGRLEKLAFRKDMHSLNIAAATSTHKGWQERVDANINAGVDMIVVDTSDGYNEFMRNLITKYKGKHDVPLCAGNVVTYEAAMFLIKSGVDAIKVGMSSGSICTTKREKATGRAPMTAVIECGKARDNYFNATGRYVSLIADGGVSSAADIIIALTVADAVMMGGYFNKFLEAAGEKYDINGNQTRIERNMHAVATWGEGSARAKNLARYAHAGMGTFFTEGEEGRVPYKGRMKPNLKKDLMKIKAAMSNAGAHNLAEYRDNAVIEAMSGFSQLIVGDTHNMEMRK